MVTLSDNQVRRVTMSRDERGSCTRTRDCTRLGVGRQSCRDDVADLLGRARATSWGNK